MLTVQPETEAVKGHLAVAYHQLGAVARDRGELEDAEDWYRRALEIAEQLGDRPGMAVSYGQLGLLAEARGYPHGALELIIRCVALFEEFPHPATGPGPNHLLRLSRKLGLDTLQRTWRDATGVALPTTIRQVVEQALAQPDQSDDTEARS